MRMDHDRHKGGSSTTAALYCPRQSWLTTRSLFPGHHCTYMQGNNLQGDIFPALLASVSQRPPECLDSSSPEPARALLHSIPRARMIPRARAVGGARAGERCYGSGQFAERHELIGRIGHREREETNQIITFRKGVGKKTSLRRRVVFGQIGGIL